MQKEEFHQIKVSSFFTLGYALLRHCTVRNGKKVTLQNANKNVKVIYKTTKCIENKFHKRLVRFCESTCVDSYEMYLAIDVK